MIATVAYCGDVFEIEYSVEGNEVIIESIHTDCDLYKHLTSKQIDDFFELTEQSESDRRHESHNR